MQHVVITYVRREQIRHGKDGDIQNRYYDADKAVINCQSKAEAETIANMLHIRLPVGKNDQQRTAKACLMLRDATGKACYFDHDYLEHVMSDMTEPDEVRHVMKTI